MESKSPQKQKRRTGFAIHMTKTGICYGPDAPAPKTPKASENMTAGEDTPAVPEELTGMLRKASAQLRDCDIIFVVFLVSLAAGYFMRVLLLVTLASLIALFYYKTRKKILLQYTIDQDRKRETDRILTPLLDIAHCAMTWEAPPEAPQKEEQRFGGEYDTRKRELCKVTTTIPYPFETDGKVITFDTRKATIIFLPDAIYLMKGKKIQALTYDDVQLSIRPVRYLEKEKPREDSKVLRKTWEHVDSSGKPDPGYKKNREISLCEYGELTISCDREGGPNTVILYSKYKKPTGFYLRDSHV